MGVQFPDLHYYFKGNKENTFNHDTERKRRIINISGKKSNGPLLAGRPLQDTELCF